MRRFTIRIISLLMRFLTLYSRCWVFLLTSLVGFPYRVGHFFLSFLFTVLPCCVSLFFSAIAFFHCVFSCFSLFFFCFLPAFDSFIPLHSVKASQVEKTLWFISFLSFFPYLDSTFAFLPLHYTTFCIPYLAFRVTLPF
jgi:hypothetical protein